MLSLEPWDDVWRRNQYLVDGLLRTDPELRVLYVEPSNDLTHSLLTRRRLVRGGGLRQAPGYEGRLHLLQPDKVLPRAVGPFADLLLRRVVRRAADRVGMIDPVLWVNDPSWAAMAFSRDRPVLYDMTDDWAEAPRAPREHRRIVANDALLSDRSDVVVVCSRGLQATRGRTREVVLIPNAVDVARYRRPAPRPADLPDGPIAMYVGTLHRDRLDVELVVATADAVDAAGGTVVLIGPNALGGADTAALEEYGAVHLLGARPRDDIPAYLQAARVLLVPHVVTPFTESLDPIKLYEYLAVGRPVVSTPVAGFREEASVWVTSVEADDYPAAVVRALRSPADAGAAAASVADWSDRVAAMRDVLYRLWSRVGAPGPEPGSQ